MARRYLWLAACLGLAAAPAFAASDKPKPTPEASPSPAAKKDKEPEPVSSDPQLTTASFGDWIERCQRVTIGGEARRLCEIALTVTAQGQSQPLAELAVGRIKRGDPLKLTLVLPVNVSFPSQPKLTPEGDDAIDFTWRQCLPAGCFADAVFSADAQKTLREAKAAKIESKAAGGQAFNFPISLRGLPQALDALAKEP